MPPPPKACRNRKTKKRKPWLRIFGNHPQTATRADEVYTIQETMVDDSIALKILSARSWRSLFGISERGVNVPEADVETIYDQDRRALEKLEFKNIASLPREMNLRP